MHQSGAAELQRVERKGYMKKMPVLEGKRSVRAPVARVYDSISTILCPDMNLQRTRAPGENCCSVRELIRRSSQARRSGAGVTFLQSMTGL